MTSKRRNQMAKKKFSEKQKLIEEIVEANKNLDTPHLLNWAMNQLFKSARELELLSAVYCKNDSLTSIGCDAVAESIFRKLIKTPEGWDLIYTTNSKLLKGYKRP